MILSSEISDKDLIHSNQNPADKSNCSSSSTTNSIDDVWNGISLSSLHHHRTTAAATNTTNHPPPFLDFFSSPTTTNPCPGHSRRFTPPPPAAAHSPRFPPPPAAAANMIRSLNSDPVVTNFLYKNGLSRSQSCKCSEPSFFPSSKTPNFNALAPSPSSSSPSLPLKRPDPEYCEKHKKLMKNRESASRSRARKQARADELEIEVERLTKENAMLKSQLQQQQQSKLWKATPAQQPKRSRLNRTLTAPF